MEMILPVVLVVGIAVAASLIAYYLMRNRYAGTVAVLASLTIALFGGLFYAASNATGWDGLGYAIAAIFLVAPGIAGLGLGTLVGWSRNARKIDS